MPPRANFGSGILRFFAKPHGTERFFEYTKRLDFTPHVLLFDIESEFFYRKCYFFCQIVFQVFSLIFEEFCTLFFSKALE